MIELVYDKNELETYKSFYEKIYIDLNAKDIDYWNDYKYLSYNADLLNEFLWGFHNDNLKFIMKNFDMEKINNYKSYDNYKWSIIFKVLNRFVTQYPNNQLVYVNDQN